eukprot:5678152-Prymnesium_polylepis.1
MSMGTVGSRARSLLSLVAVAVEGWGGGNVQRRVLYTAANRAELYRKPRARAPGRPCIFFRTAGAVELCQRKVDLIGFFCATKSHFHVILIILTSKQGAPHLIWSA